MVLKAGLDMLLLIRPVLFFMVKITKKHLSFLIF